MIGKIIQFFLNIFRFHKLKIFFVLFTSAIFSIVLFSYDDLSEVVTATVAERTGGQVFLQFDSLGFQLFPFPALAVENVEVESALFPSLQASRLSFAPSVLGFLSFRPGYHIAAKGLWDGSVDLDLKSGKKNEQGITLQDVQFELSRLDVAKIAELAHLPLKLQGRFSSDSRVAVDPTFAAQPEGDLQFSIKELRFPPGTIPTAMGPIALPGMNWSTVKAATRLSNGRLNIERLELGSTTDPFYGTAKGDFDLRFESVGSGRLQPVLGAYSVIVDLNVNPKIERELVFLVFLSAYKSATANATHYRFKLSGNSLGGPPSIAAAPSK